MTMFREVENKDLPCLLFGYIMDAEETNALFDTMDIYYAALGEGNAELEVPVSKMHYNTLETVHSGVFAGLMDAAMGMAVLTKNKVATAISVNTSYLKPASKGDVLKAKATVTLDEDTVCHCTCQIKNQREELLATGQGTFRVQISDFVQYYAAKLRENGYQ